MPMIRILSAVEQVADFLQDQMLSGRWKEFLPGVDALADELGVSRKTVDAALQQLEREGWLVNQGPRRKRRIELQADLNPPALRVAILADETTSRRPRYIVEAIHELLDAGHTASFVPGHMSELWKDPKRIARLLEKNPADAWVVVSGPRAVLEWFSRHEKPTFALFGRRQGLPLAGIGPDKVTAYASAARALMALGHKRIVLFARRMSRVPDPGESEKAFLNELDAHGIQSGTYNLPDWAENIDGLHARLDSLFRYTPPTALIVDEAPLFAAVQQFLAQRKILIPQDVSMICTDSDATFAWCKQTVAHIKWDSKPLVSRLVRWAANVSRGKKDLRQTITPAKFVTGDTIGPPKR